MNILFCSVGRRAKLLKNLKESHPNVKILATDNSPYAPALNFADQKFLAPRIDDPNYIDFLLDLCKQHDIKAITTLIDPEIELLSKNRNLFLSQGVLPLCPDESTAKLCFDKFLMYQYLTEKNIDTILTYGDIESFQQALQKGEINFPVFIKPRAGSASVGAERIENLTDLEDRFKKNFKHNYIIQELMLGDDIDADVYIDYYNHQPVAAFSKKKLETKIGGASKTISFKDQKLFDFIEEICKVLTFNGPVDMDFWYKDGQYFLSEVNPRFGGAYLHAYGAGVDFFKLIQNNMEGKTNESIIGKYEDDVLMMMYDSVVIVSKDELVK